MLKIVIKNVRGCSSAEFDLDPGITLLGGDNRAGKTSIIQAMGCALSATATPLGAMKKKDLKAILHNGAAEGYAMVQRGDGTASILWPGADTATKGTPPRASTYAVGLQHIFDLEWKQRAGIMLADYLSNAAPAFEDLAAEVKAAGIEMTDKQLTAIWEIVQQRGWDAAQTECKDSGAKLKGMWELVTGETYGSSKAESWTPKDWTPDMADKDPAQLAEAAVVAAREMESTVGSAAVTMAELQRLESADIAVKTLVLEASEADAAAVAADAAEEEAKKKLDGMMRPPADTTGLSCPHCGAAVAVVTKPGGLWSITKADELSTADIKKMTSDYRGADAAYTQAKLQARSARSTADTKSKALGSAKSDSIKLAEAKKNARPDDMIATAKAAVETTAAMAKMVKAYLDAKQLHARVLRAVAIVEILGADGVRHKKLGAAIEAFNTTYMKPVTVSADWPEIKLGDDLLPTDSGRPFFLLSESEQWRARAVMTIAMGLRDKSDVICLDGADVLTPGGRNALFSMLSDLKLPPIVVGMALDRNPPDLAAAGIGRTILVKDGVAPA